MALAAAALAAAAPGQDVDWAAAVEKANTHRRYALRLAAAKKIARGEDGAIAAVRAYDREHGSEVIAMPLVDAIARGPARGDEVVALLEHWAFDRDFYWRSHALHGLALRNLPQLRDRYHDGLADPSHLFRVEAARALLRLGAGEREAGLRILQDEDPRARTAGAIALLELDNAAGLPEAVHALGRTDRFLDDPWGERWSRRAAKALVGYANRQGVEGDFGLREDPEQARAALASWARVASGAKIDSATAPEQAIDAAGGLEIRSCRNGDLFCRWSEDGQLLFGLEGGSLLRLDGDTWEELRAGLEGGRGRDGRVICDFLRIQHPDEYDRKVAPGALPAGMHRWLEALADALEAGRNEQEAAALRGRLAQFAPNGER